MKRIFSANFFSKAIAVASFSFLFFVAGANAQCDTDAEMALYNKFLESFKGSAEQQKTASQIGRDYIAKFGKCASDEEKKITDYIQKWLISHEAALAENNCISAVKTTPDQAFEQCQAYVTKDPESVRPYLLLTFAGSKNGKTTDAKFKENSVRAAKKALDLIAAGKTTDNWIFGKQPADAVGAINYWAGFYSLEASPSDAAAFFVNAAKSTSGFAKEPAVYDALARAVYNSEYKAAALEYNNKCSTTPASECDALYAKAGQILDKVIDAYARAIALSKDPASVTTTRSYLTALYKQRHNNSEEGLDKLIADVLSKPMP
jgi:hypothetical protein